MILTPIVYILQLGSLNELTKLRGLNNPTCQLIKLLHALNLVVPKDVLHPHLRPLCLQLHQVKPLFLDFLTRNPQEARGKHSFHSMELILSFGISVYPYSSSQVRKVDISDN